MRLRAAAAGGAATATETGGSRGAACRTRRCREAPRAVAVGEPARACAPASTVPSARHRHAIARARPAARPGGSRRPTIRSPCGKSWLTETRATSGSSATACAQRGGVDVKRGHAALRPPRAPRARERRPSARPRRSPSHALTRDERRVAQPEQVAGRQHRSERRASATRRRRPCRPKTNRRGSTQDGAGKRAATDRHTARGSPPISALLPAFRPSGPPAARRGVDVARAQREQEVALGEQAEQSRSASSIVGVTVHAAAVRGARGGRGDQPAAHAREVLRPLPRGVDVEHRTRRRRGPAPGRTRAPARACASRGAAGSTRRPAPRVSVRAASSVAATSVGWWA